ncbi:MAG: putative metallopeptidase [Candidatus Micrarchaeota archaeon]|nr:putative metallopeptidase [Candidatus Micrarchaeota archaeon]
MAKVRYEKAPDVDRIVQAVMARFAGKLAHINQFRVLCVRSYGSQARAYARIWSMPQVWKTALEIDAFYVIEVLHEHFDKLPAEQKERTILHELLHIPKTFSGALLPHVYGKDGLHIEEMVKEIYE